MHSSIFQEFLKLNWRDNCLILHNRRIEALRPSTEGGNEMFLRELRATFRTLRKARGYALAAVLSLALGIGGNVAMFSLLNAVLLRPLGYPHPERLFLIKEDMPKFRQVWGVLSETRTGYVLHWRKQLHSFESIGATSGTTMALTGPDGPARIGAVMMTAEFLDVLGIKPQLGRSLLRSDEENGAPDVVILSDALWHRSFAADPNILGREIVLDGKPRQVVGVTPAGMLFYGVFGSPPGGAELFLPLRVPPDELDLTKIESYYWSTAIVRLKPGTTLQRTQAEFEVSMAAISRANREHVEIHAQLEPWQNAIVGDTRKGLLVLMGAVGLVLLIVCVNIANLSLVRATKNRRELAVRVALGAGRRHLVRASLMESMIIGAGGTILGLVLAVWIQDLVIRFGPAQLPRLNEATLDFHVVAFAVGLCVLTVILFGLLPAWAMSQLSPLESIQSASRSHTDGPRGSYLRAALVSAEIALSIPLLIGAGLLLASLVRVLSVPRGIRMENVISVNLAVPETQFQDAGRRISFFRRVLEGVSSLPGVQYAGYTSGLPLGDPLEISPAVPEGSSENLPLDARPVTAFAQVSADYFPAVGIPLRSGRLFRPGEKQLVALVSESAARHVWPNQNPIGKQVRRFVDPNKNHWFTVVGVVGDVRSDGVLKASYPPIYFPYWQIRWQDGANELFLVVRTTVELRAVTAAIRDQVWKVDRNIPVNKIRKLTGMMRDSVTPRQFQAVMVTIFAAVALLLTCIGTYGVIAYAVAQRRVEIGVRLALGANRRDIKSMTLRQGLKPVVIGLAIGTFAATVVARLIANLLFEVRPFDTLAFVASILLVTLVAAFACHLPARHAADTDPIMALRYE
jgi:putative ABC transport system permease protein